MQRARQPRGALPPGVPLVIQPGVPPADSPAVNPYEIIFYEILKWVILVTVLWVVWSRRYIEIVPPLEEGEWWGPKELNGTVDEDIKPFKIEFNDEMIRDLRHRLHNHRPFTPPLEDMAFQYGFNTNELGGWISYWADEYDFKAREAFLNQYKHYKTNIQGLDIHFVWVKPNVTKAVKVLPLLIIHGWPGSVREFYEVIPLLTTERPGYDFVFELVIPSLPGFGYSDPSARPGLAYPQVALMFKGLMNRLGYEKFYVQGGDWGAFIGNAMATVYKEEVLGYHTNMAFLKSSIVTIAMASSMPSLIVEPHLEDRLYPLSKFFAFVTDEFGYFHLQSTKPDSIGVALNDSPTGMLAYIFEKFSTWTNINNVNKTDGGLQSMYTKDKLIDNLMMYWVTSTMTTSMRFYYENAMHKTLLLDLDANTTTVPTWAYQAKYELGYQPPYILKSKFLNLINVTVTEDGGHFLALEQPEAFSDDVFRAVKAFTEFHEEKEKLEL